MGTTSFYKRSNFVTHLPVDCLYSPSHFWLREIEPGRWRVGFTKFATRMLGEIVEVQWEKAGLLELADIVAVNKADLPAADRVRQQLEHALSLDPAALTAPRKPDGSLPEIPLMRPAPGGKVIDRGVPAGLPYSGRAPEPGAYEAPAPAAAR